MKKIDVRKIEPAGWVALAVAAVLVLAILGLAFRFAWPRLVGIERLEPMSESNPVLALTPTSANRAPSGPPKPDSTGAPAGWTMQKDITGKEHLTPPPEDEAAIREAFEAVMALFVAADVSDEVAMGYDWNEIVERASGLAEAEIVDRYAARNFFMLADLGPENPISCENYGTCTAMRAKMGSGGAVDYDENRCMTAQGVSTISQDPTQCVFREFTDQNPYQVYVATVKLEEDDVWRVTDWQIENISPPPSP